MTAKSTEAPAPEGSELKKLEKAAAEKAQAVERGIAGWVNEHIRNSPVSQSVEAWNHLTDRLGALTAAIVKEL